MNGVKTSPTSDCTIPLKAAPMITPTARSATLPRMANSLNSFSIAPLLLVPAPETPRRHPSPFTITGRVDSGAKRSRGLAFTPMRRLHFQPALRIGVDPSPISQAAGKHQRIGAELIDDLQLDFAVGRRGVNRFPEAVVLFGTIKRHAVHPIRFIQRILTPGGPLCSRKL